MTSCQWLSQGNLSWIYFYRKFLRRLNNYYHKNDCILTAFSGSTVHPSYYGDSCCIAIFVKQLVNDLKKIHIEKKPNTTQSQQLFLPQFPQQPVQKAACDCPEPPPLCLFSILSRDIPCYSRHGVSLLLLQALIYLYPIYLAINPSLLCGNFYHVCSFSYISVLYAALDCQPPWSQSCFLL